MNKAPIIVVPKYHRLGEGFNDREKLKALEHPGRRTQIKGYQSPASWVADVTGTRQALLLCSYCRVKFDPKKHKYRRQFTPDLTGKTSGYVTNGQCDGCKENTALTGGGTLYIAEEFWEQVSVDPAEARRRARAQWQNHEGMSLLTRAIRENQKK